MDLADTLAGVDRQDRVIVELTSSRVSMARSEVTSQFVLAVGPSLRELAGENPFAVLARPRITAATSKALV